MSPLYRLAALALCAVFFATIACNSKGKPPVNGGADLRGLPTWEGPLQRLFDDSIHPAAVGMSLDGREPAEDPLLVERARAADVVARMRVSTVTVDSVGAKVNYTLVLQVGYPTLLPVKIDDRSFELHVSQRSPAFTLVQSVDTGLRGKTFIGFVSRFVGTVGGEQVAEIHWHLTADTAAVAEAIQVAAFGVPTAATP